MPQNLLDHVSVVHCKHAINDFHNTHSQTRASSLTLFLHFCNSSDAVVLAFFYFDNFYETQSRSDKTDFSMTVMLFFFHASTHLHKSPSVGWSVYPSVRWSVTFSLNSETVNASFLSSSPTYSSLSYFSSSPSRGASLLILNLFCLTFAKRCL